MSVPLYVGIDWADDHHDACLTNDSGDSLAQFRFTHTAEGFDDLHKNLAAHALDPKDIVVALETSNGLLVHDLVQHNYHVYAINPKAANRYKDRHKASGAKSDPLDARALAHLLRTDRFMHRELELLQDDYRLMDELCNDLRKLVGDTGRITNQILSCLKKYHPQAIDVFSALDSAIYIAFLRKYPNPTKLGELSRNSFEAFLKDQHYTCPKRSSDLYKQISRRSLRPDKIVAQAAEMHLHLLLDQLEELMKHRKIYETEIKAILDRLPETDVISSLPGAGRRLVPEIAAIIGPNLKEGPQRFADAQAIASLAGCVPVTKQSGRHKSVVFRRACNLRMRRTFFDWAQCTIKHSRWAQAFYKSQRKAMKDHATIIRCLAIKWIKILYRLWTTGEQYDEELHIARLKQRNVIWAASLELREAP